VYLLQLVCKYSLCLFVLCSTSTDWFCFVCKDLYVASFQALDRGAAKMKAVKMATGHNADDVAETVLLNILRGDIARYAYHPSIVRI